MPNELTLVIRIVIAALCGAAIGFERSRRQKEAGIRTHIMVTLGASLLVIVSKYGFIDIVGTPGINVDVSRIAANVITGVSFLGAGVIFLRGGYVKGLTTAAGIWSTCGVGCAIGAGMYIIGIVATLMIIVIQLILHWSLPSSENMTVSEISFRTEYKQGIIADVNAYMREIHVKVLRLSMKKKKDGTVLINMTVRIPHNLMPDSILDAVSSKYIVSEFTAQM